MLFFPVLVLETCSNLPQSLPLRITNIRSGQVGLLLACRQTHQEYRAVLFSHAQFIISIADYNFGNLVRVLERLSERDIAALKLNSRLWIEINVSHVPGRDDRRKLKGWCDYRASDDAPPYFGPGRKAANDLIFEYDVKFLNQLRPPRPMCRYANGYQVKVWFYAQRQRYQ